MDSEAKKMVWGLVPVPDLFPSCDEMSRKIASEHWEIL